jgi:gas vesicle protein
MSAIANVYKASPSRNVSFTSTRSAVVAKPVPRVVSRNSIAARSSNGQSSAGIDTNSFLSGVVVGGVIIGGLAVLLAPQISNAMAEDRRVRVPRFLDVDERDPHDPESARLSLAEQIAQLNRSIDEVADKLKTKATTTIVTDDSVNVMSN